MITKFHIENFKSLVEFDLPAREGRLGNFTCIIGLNGSGKSTLLQAFGFIGQLALGRMSEWLAQREWENNDLVSKIGTLTKRSYVVTFRVTFCFEHHPDVVWSGRYNTNQLRCTEEVVTVSQRELLIFKEQTLKLADSNGEWNQSIPKLDLVFQGSIFSVLQLSNAHPALIQLKEFLVGLKSLELLSPQLMRRKARQALDIGVGGEKLSPFLAQLSIADHDQLNQIVQSFYPHVKNWNVRKYRAGWKSLRVTEDFETVTSTEAAHLNDGMLRIFAILAQAYSKHTFLLFDEIENGMNAELVKKLVDFLIRLGKQVIVTTHSPIILNYIPDKIARDAVVFLYKTRTGQTKAVRFFDYPRMAAKLRALGPGEVYVDTRLTDLVHELEQTLP